MLRLILFSLIIVLQIGCGRIWFFLERNTIIGISNSGLDYENIYIPMDSFISILKSRPYLKINYIKFENDSLRVKDCLQNKSRNWPGYDTISCDTNELFKRNLLEKDIGVSHINGSIIEGYSLTIEGDTVRLRRSSNRYVKSCAVLWAVKFKGDTTFSGPFDMDYKRYKCAKKLFRQVIVYGRPLK